MKQIAQLAAFSACLCTPLHAQWQTNASGIYYGGNVGIGTSAPTSTLDVNGPIAIEQKNFGGYAGLNIKGLSPNYNWPNIGFSTQNTQGVDVVAANITGQIVSNTQGAEAMDLLLCTMNSGLLRERLRITNSGNVGIGTANTAGYKLAVDGSIGARDIVVTSTPWPDYVFQPGYRLRPLSEVNAFIQTNRHLPEIPSEAEVKEKGVSVGEMQAKLLAKIEELTLHMIEAEKQNRELRDRIARLEKHD